MSLSRRDEAGREIHRVARNSIVQKACVHVKALIRKSKPEWVQYHNFHHAKRVVEACKTIGAASNLGSEDLELVVLAAWFHDLGYMEGIAGHEERSCSLATSFLRENGYPEEKITRVAGCIQATRMPQNPANILEQVLCDADIAHLARNDYLELSERVRLEIEHHQGARLSDEAWLAANIGFVEGHQYFTEYAKTRFEKQRRRNLAVLRDQMDRLKGKGEKSPQARKSKKQESLKELAGSSGDNPIVNNRDAGRLGASLEPFISIFDDIDEKMYVSDPETYKILYANLAKKAVFGQDIVGKKCHTVFQGMDKPCEFCTNPMIFGNNLGKTHIWEFKNRKTGAWLRCIDRAIPWNDGRMVRFEMAIDIHERKVAEDALQESEKKYRELVENIHEVVFSTDETGLMTYVSPSIQALTGFFPSEIEGRHFSGFIFKDDFELVVRRFGEALLGQKKPTEYRLITKSGNPVWVRSMSKPICEGDEVKGLRGVLSDITEQKNAAAALRASEMKYRELLGAMNEGFRVVDEKGITTYVNEKLCAMLGYEAHEIIGRSVADFLGEESKEIWEKEFERRAKGQFESYEIPHITKDGREIYTLISPKPVLDEEGRFSGSFSVITDITKLKRIEAALTMREKELRVKANHLEEMNAALRVLLKAREQDRIDLEEKVLVNVREHVIPYLDKLKNRLENEKQKAYADIVEANLRGITSSFSRDLHIRYLQLTHTELHVAGLIREGKTSGEIADLMNISCRTVESHRKNIRKKMGLNEMKGNLRATLMSFE